MTISFSGHRTERINNYESWDENTDTVIRVKHVLSDLVRFFTDHGQTEYICGGALGVDMWAAEIVVEHKLDLTLILPYEQGYGVNWKNKKDFDRLNDLKDRSKETLYVSRAGYSVKSLFQRNEWMVDRSIATIFVWDGNKKGGTYRCLKYARKTDQAFIYVGIEGTKEHKYFLGKQEVDCKNFSNNLFGSKIVQPKLF